MDNLLDLQMNTALSGASAADRAPRMPAAGSEEQARAAAQDFESFFISQMMDQMFAQVGEDNPFGGGAGENAFRGMLNEEYGKVIAQAGGLGLSDRLTTEILRYQEAAGGTDE